MRLSAISATGLNKGMAPEQRNGKPSLGSGFLFVPCCEGGAANET